MRYSCGTPALAVAGDRWRWNQGTSRLGNPYTSDHAMLKYCVALKLGVKPTLGQRFVFTGQRIPIGIQNWNRRCVSRGCCNVICE